MKTMTKIAAWPLGDSTYPLNPCLLIPFHTPMNNIEELFNQHQTSARNCVERSNCVLECRYTCTTRSMTKHKNLQIQLTRTEIFTNFVEHREREIEEFLSVTNNKSDLSIEIKTSLKILNTSNAGRQK